MIPHYYLYDPLYRKDKKQEKIHKKEHILYIRKHHPECVTAITSLPWKKEISLENKKF